MAPRSPHPLAALISLFCCASLSCTGARSASGECLGYSCDDAGARAMMEDTLNAKFQPSDAAKASLDAAFDAGVERMKKEGFTPDSFDLAKANLTRFLNDVPDAGQDALAPEAEALKNKTAKACPLYPFC